MSFTQKKKYEKLLRQDNSRENVSKRFLKMKQILATKTLNNQFKTITLKINCIKKNMSKPFPNMIRIQSDI